MASTQEIFVGICKQQTTQYDQHFYISLIQKNISQGKRV